MPSRDWAHLCLYVDAIQQKQFSLAPEASDIAEEQKKISGITEKQGRMNC